MLSTLLVSAGLFALPSGVNPALFPGAAERAPSEVELAGLSVLYPGRVLREAPRVADPGSDGRPPLVAELPRGCTYVRIYDLSTAVPRLAELLPRPAMIVDLRYVVGDAQTAEQFASALAHAGLAASPIKLIGDLSPRLLTSLPLQIAATPPPPLIVLINGQTAGPLEAWLAAFQSKDSLLTVGAPTAGQAGEYQRAGAGGLYVITGELQPDAGSIVGRGVQPNFAVEVSPAQDYRAYQEVERGADPQAMLRRERSAAPAPTAPAANGTPASSTTPPAPVPPPPAADDEGGDPVLQRAVDVVAALQILKRMPPSTPAAKAPAAPPAAPATSPSPSPNN